MGTFFTGVLIFDRIGGVCLVLREEKLVTRSCCFATCTSQRDSRTLLLARGKTRPRTRVLPAEKSKRARSNRIEQSTATDATCARRTTVVNFLPYSLHSGGGGSSPLKMARHISGELLSVRTNLRFNDINVALNQNLSLILNPMYIIHK